MTPFRTQGTVLVVRDLPAFSTLSSGYTALAGFAGIADFEQSALPVAGLRLAVPPADAARGRDAAQSSIILARSGRKPSSPGTLLEKQMSFKGYIHTWAPH
jgi:hypothetical protein